MLHLAMFTMGGPELLVVLIVALLVFGKRLPQVTRSLGSSVREFKQGMKELKA